MPTKAAETQGPRNEVVSVATTAEEKEAVRRVAAASGMTQSEVLRTWPMDEVMERYRKMVEALGGG